MIVYDVPGIPLRRADGTVDYAIVDPEDFVAANDYRWTRSGNGYVVRHYVVDGRHKSIYLHRWLMGLEPGDGKIVDHANRDKLDNRRVNLRVGDAQSNAENRGNFAGKSSRFRGVYWHAQIAKWVARVTLRGKHHYLGTFDTEEQAALVASAFRAEHMPFAVEGGGR